MARRNHVKSIGLCRNCPSKRSLKVIAPADFKRVQFDAERLGCTLRIAQLVVGVIGIFIGQRLLKFAGPRP